MTQSMSPIKGIIFDLDGVLTDTSELHYRAWKQLGADLGLDVSPTLKDEVRGLSRRASLDVLLRSRSVSEVEAAALMERKNRYYLALIEQLSPQDVLPGVRELLTEIRAAGLRVAVASASRNAATVIERLGLTSMVDVICDGASVEQLKPAPDLFLHAAARLGLLPQECLVIEDAAAGVEAARAAEMRVVGIGPPDQVGAADLVLPSLAGVRLDDLLRSVAAQRG